MSKFESFDACSLIKFLFQQQARRETEYEISIGNTVLSAVCKYFSCMSSASKFRKKTDHIGVYAHFYSNNCRIICHVCNQHARANSVVLCYEHIAEVQRISMEMSI